jgi:Recombinase
LKGNGRVNGDGRTSTSFEWRPIRYRNVISILKNPFYAGVYAYGKSEKRTAIVDGRARKSYGHRKPMDAWEVFIKDHHEGYIGWAEFERNQAQLAGNAYGRVGDTKSSRGGRALLAGLIHCARCGRRLAAAFIQGGRPTGATGPICNWAKDAALGSVAAGSATQLQPGCCAPWRRWRSRRQRRPSE